MRIAGERVCSVSEHFVPVVNISAEGGWLSTSRSATMQGRGQEAHPVEEPADQDFDKAQQSGGQFMAVK
jgi:hypothetical protein